MDRKRVAEFLKQSLPERDGGGGGGGGGPLRHVGIIFIAHSGCFATGITPNPQPKLQALYVYHILPPTAAIIDYAVGLEKLPANGQFLVGD